MIENYWLNNIRRALFATALTLLLPLAAANAFADEAARISELERQVMESNRIIEKLLERVQELERKAAQQPGEAAPGQAASLTAPENLTGVRSPESGDRDLSFLDDVTWLHGFADVGMMYNGKRQGEAQKRKGFAVGALDFYLTPQLGNNVKSLAELIFEVNDSGETMAELERLQIGYAFGDYLTLWGGRFHTPLGYWNTAYHHGKQIQTTALRPKYLDFEEDYGIVPTHTVGIIGTGGLRLGAGKLSYDLFVGNGPKITENGKLDSNTFSDDNHNLALGFNLGYDFKGVLDGLRIGLHGLRSEVEAYGPQGTHPGRTDLNILGGYGVYAADDWELIAEFYQFINRSRSGDSATRYSSLGFLQAGRLFGRLMPYSRFEFASIDTMDKYFSNLRDGYSYRRILAGIRYELTPKAALKLEGNHTRIINRERDDYYEFISQFAIHF